MSSQHQFSGVCIQRYYVDTPEDLLVLTRYKRDSVTDSDR